MLSMRACLYGRAYKVWPYVVRFSVWVYVNEKLLRYFVMWVSRGSQIYGSAGQWVTERMGYKLNYINNGSLFNGDLFDNIW